MHRFGGLNSLAYFSKSALLNKRGFLESTICTTTSLLSRTLHSWRQSSRFLSNGVNTIPLPWRIKTMDIVEIPTNLNQLSQSALPFNEHFVLGYFQLFSIRISVFRWTSRNTKKLFILLNQGIEALALDVFNVDNRSRSTGKEYQVCISKISYLSTSLKSSLVAAKSLPASSALLKNSSYSFSCITDARAFPGPS